MDIISLITQVLQHKDITECPDIRLNVFQRRKIKKEILENYREYHKFMCIDENHTFVHQLPDYNLYLKECPDNMELAAVNYEDGNYNLYVSGQVFKNGMRKDILFHEFTHIYDKEFFNSKWKFNKNPTVDYTHICSEIHAEQVKFLFVLGCHNIREVPIEITPQTKIVSLQGWRQEFFEYLSNMKKEIVDYSNQFKEVKKQNRKLNDKPFISITNKIAYYIGAFSVYQRYCEYEVEQLLDFSQVTDFWEKDMKVSDKQSLKNLQDLISLCCKNEIEQLSKVQISEIGTLLMYNWMANAKDNLYIR